MSLDSTILVVGSINMDLAVRCPRIPVPGETILGSSLIESPGGKGANQAVAAALLGGAVAMVGCHGNDSYGQTLRHALQRAGASVRHVLERGDRSGVALIEVSEQGENSIVVVPGANALLTPDDVKRALQDTPTARALVLQLEVPLDTVREAARMARARGLTVLLDPAPVQPLPESLLREVDILLPNQGEAALLTQMDTVEATTAQEAGTRLRARGPRVVLVKLGRDGVLIVDESGVRLVPGISVDAIDTVAAGDCLAGALTVALVEGRPLVEAVTFANAAAALSTTRFGAQSAMPDREAVERLLRRQ